MIIYPGGNRTAPNNGLDKVSTLEFKVIIEQGHISRDLYKYLNPKQLIEFGREQCRITDD